MLPGTPNVCLHVDSLFPTYLKAFYYYIKGAIISAQSRWISHIVQNFVKATQPSRCHGIIKLSQKKSSAVYYECTRTANGSVFCCLWMNIGQDLINHESFLCLATKVLSQAWSDPWYFYFFGAMIPSSCVWKLEKKTDRQEFWNSFRNIKSLFN